MGLVKTRRLAAMQKLQRAKAGMRPKVAPDLKKDGLSSPKSNSRTIFEELGMNGNTEPLSWESAI